MRRGIEGVGGGFWVNLIRLGEKASRRCLDEAVSRTPKRREDFSAGARRWLRPEAPSQLRRQQKQASLAVKA